MPPILALPGLLCTHEAFADLQQMLPGQALDVAQLPPLDDFNAITDALAPRLAPGTTILGMSMGAYLALALARRMPERVARLILVGASARPDTAEAIEGRLKVVGWARKAGTERLAAAVADQMLGGAQRNDTRLRERLRRMAETVGLETFARHQAALASRPDARPALPGIACPTLVVTGDEDKVTPPELGRELAEALPRGQHLALPGIGHLPLLEAPQVMAEALTRFLSPSESRA